MRNIHCQRLRPNSYKKQGCRKVWQEKFKRGKEGAMLFQQENLYCAKLSKDNVIFVVFTINQ